jgi:UDP-2,3-diacylglucosamine pyrophosphatase LpxH
MSDDDRNILIISDLHLGEDIKPTHANGKAILRHVAVLERELTDFLTHYTRVRRDGTPWRLIINGDMVDFLSVCLLPPGGEGGLEAEADPEDRVYGLGTRPLQARTKMEHVLERHPGVFRALAGFIAAGNVVGIVVGNHDVEFHWPVVQETFKKGVAGCYRGARATAAEIEAGIVFHPWFYFLENVVWVEHGHQYDDYCSFDYILNPVAPEKEEVVMSLGAAGYRYVSNHVAGSDPHQQEDWNMLGFLRFGIMLGARGVWKLIKGYLAMVWRLLSIWRVLTKQRDKVEARRRTHRERLRALAEQVKLSEETLVALDNLRRRPVVTNFFRLAAAIMLDRLLVAATAALLILVFVLALPWGWAATAVLTVVGAAWAAAQILARTRGKTDPQEKMKLVPQKIRAHVRAPFVVFGHSHHPLALKLEGEGWYFNTGTWLAVERPGLLHAFTHVMIRRDKGRLRAGLCQWRDGKSQPVGPEATARAA